MADSAPGGNFGVHSCASKMRKAQIFGGLKFSEVTGLFGSPTLSHPRKDQLQSQGMSIYLWCMPWVMVRLSIWLGWSLVLICCFQLPVGSSAAFCRMTRMPALRSEPHPTHHEKWTKEGEICVNRKDWKTRGILGRGGRRRHSARACVCVCVCASILKAIIFNKIQ